jgi:hypothetical protein
MDLEHILQGFVMIMNVITVFHAILARSFSFVVVVVASTHFM